MRYASAHESIDKFFEHTFIVIHAENRAVLILGKPKNGLKDYNPNDQSLNLTTMPLSKGWVEQEMMSLMKSKTNHSMRNKSIPLGERNNGIHYPMVLIKDNYSRLCRAEGWSSQHKNPDLPSRISPSNTVPCFQTRLTFKPNSNQSSLQLWIIPTHLQSTTCSSHPSSTKTPATA